MLQKFFLRTGAADHAATLAQLDATLERRPERRSAAARICGAVSIGLLAQEECAVAKSGMGGRPSGWHILGQPDPNPP